MRWWREGPRSRRFDPARRAGATAGIDRNDRIIYNTATGDLYYDRDGNKPGGHAAVLFATLSGAPAIDAGDFQIV